MYNQTLESMSKNFSSDNYGRDNNARMFSIGELDIYFSYDTVVAFRKNYGDLKIIKNYWGTTTGGHLNAIDEDKSIRMSNDDFNQALKELLTDLKL